MELPQRMLHKISPTNSRRKYFHGERKMKRLMKKEILIPLIMALVFLTWIFIIENVRVCQIKLDGLIKTDINKKLPYFGDTNISVELNSVHLMTPCDPSMISKLVSLGVKGK